jgi:lipopolysaccharide transport system ATP-binding protein
MDIAIKADHLSKRYRIGQKEAMHDHFGTAVIDFIKTPIKNFQKYRSLYQFGESDSDSPDIIWALTDVSFEVKKGEVLGIIGRNGAGKSTLLKILSRITNPTDGQAEIRGRVSSLLEVGTGFHQELTGRENIYLNGTILGMRKKEIDHKIKDIIEFSGIKKFIDTPVKRFSSGMKVRLAFSVAAHLEPEILIIDEVLAVGDAEFQKKCLGKMHDFTKEGRTVIFVSHNMGAVIELCPRAIILKQGRIIDDGPSKPVVEKYLSSLFQPTEEADKKEANHRSGDGRLRFESIYLQDGEGRKTSMPIAGNPMDIVIEFSAKEDLSKVEFVLTIFNSLGVAVTHCSVRVNGQGVDINKGSGCIACCIPKLPLPMGKYKISVAAHDSISKLDADRTACVFDVNDSNFFDTQFMPPIRYSTVLLEHSWKLAS